MKMCRYKFSEPGIKEMYQDSLEMIFEAMEDKHPDFNMLDLDIMVSIGDKEIKIPLHADSFEMLFECLEKIAGEE